MVVFIINDLRIFPHEDERDSPVSADAHRPGAGTVADEFVQAKAWQVHILGRSRRVKTAEDQSEPVGVGGLNASSTAGFEESCQSLVLETSYHDGECNLQRIGHQRTSKPKGMPHGWHEITTDSIGYLIFWGDPNKVMQWVEGFVHWYNHEHKHRAIDTICLVDTM